MCWQDIKIARKTGRTLAKVNLLAASTVIFVPYNPRRYALILGQNIVDVYTYGWDSDLLGGIGVFNTGQNLTNSINLREHGALVFGPIYARANTTDIVVPYYESVLEVNSEDELKRYLEAM